MGDIAAAVEAHADKIMRAAGSSIRHYETRSRQAIVMAVMDLYEEAYRAGAKLATDTLTNPTPQSDERIGE